MSDDLISLRVQGGLSGTGVAHGVKTSLKQTLVQQGILPGGVAGETVVRPGHSLDHTGRAALLLLLGQSGIVHLPHNLSEELVHHGLTLG